VIRQRTASHTSCSSGKHLAAANVLTIANHFVSSIVIIRLLAVSLCTPEGWERFAGGFLVVIRYFSKSPVSYESLYFMFSRKYIIRWVYSCPKSGTTYSEPTCYFQKRSQSKHKSNMFENLKKITLLSCRRNRYRVYLLQVPFK